MSTAFDDFLQRNKRAQERQAEVLAEASAGTSPDEAARRARTARQFGVTPAVAGEMSAAEHVAEVREAIGRQPRVGEWIRGSGERAALARGGMSNLADTSEHFEQQTQPRGTLDRIARLGGPSPITGIVGAYQTLRNSWADLTLENINAAIGAGSVGVVSGALGALEAIAENGGVTGTQALAERFAEQMGFGRPGTADALARQRSSLVTPARQMYESYATEIRPQAKTETGKGVLSGIESIPGSLVSLAGGAYIKSASLAAGLMGVTTGGQSYGQARDYGLSAPQAALYAGIDAAIESGTEIIPFSRIMPGAGRGLTRRVVESTVTDVLGEQLATLGQDFNRWAQIDVNEGKTFGDFMAERPEAAYQTLIASLVTSGAISGAVTATEIAARKLGRRAAEASAPDETERFARGLSQLAAASVVLERDATSFADFVRQAAEQTDGPTDVFIEAEQLEAVFNQSDLTVEQVYEMTGMMPEELQAAAARGEDIVIPVEQYAAKIAAQPINEQLMPHLRLDADDMSRKQAEVFLQEAQAEFDRDAAIEMDKIAAGDERAASRAVVEEQVLAQLNQTRRFTDDVNRVYASLVGAFFDTQSAKVGMTAEELAAEYGLQVQSGEIAQPTFDQAAPMVNIGLRVSDAQGGGEVDPDAVRAALTGMGVNIRHEAIHQSDSEPTFVATLDRALTPDEAATISEQLQQDAIAQSAGDQTGLFGPRAADWGAFNPEFFLDLQGRRLSETFNQSAAALQTLPLQVRPSGNGGRPLNKDLGEALTLRHREQYGRPLDPTSPEDYQVALNSLLEDYADQQQQPDNGEAWYSDDIAEAVAVTTRILPELEDPVRRDIFLTAVAILSPQQGPVLNWANAIDAMTGYSITGRFALEKPDGSQFGVGAHRTGLRLLQHLIDTKGEIGALVWLSDEHTGREMEAVRRESGIFQNKADNYLPKEMNFTESKLGAYVFGPKVGDFMLNSAGIDQNAVTVDLWMARTYNRIIGRLMDVNAKTAAEGGLADAMRGKAERAIVKQLVRDAAQQAGITPSAMQAALWYFEQRLYRNHGIRSESTSFSDAAREAATSRGIPVDGVTARGSAAGSYETEIVDPAEGVRVYNQDGLNPLDAFKRESFYPTRATRHEDGTVYADIPPYYPERQDRIADVIGARAVVAVEAGDARLGEGVDLWHYAPPINPDGTITIHHWGPAGIAVTDPLRWGANPATPRSERQMLTSGLPRTYFGIASGQPGGYIIEFPYKTQYEARVPAERLYDVQADPDGLKPAKNVIELEYKIKEAGYLGYWTQDDQLGLVAVVFEPLPVQPAQAQVYAQDAVFYSALERAIEKTATTKASAQQWEATLRKTPGIKQEELEWTGLLDFLAMTEGPITREQILELVRAAGVRVDEVVLGDVARIRERARELFLADNEVRISEGVQPLEDNGDYGGYMFTAENEFARQRPQFASWTSDPQNPSYRELLITLPPHVTGRQPSTHWDAPGVIAHARFMDKTDADGKKVLFIEEVQSDWHQKGRDQGYETERTKEEDARLQREFDDAFAALGAATEAALAKADAVLEAWYQKNILLNRDSPEYDNEGQGLYIGYARVRRENTVQLDGQIMLAERLMRSTRSVSGDQGQNITYNTQQWIEEKRAYDTAKLREIEALQKLNRAAIASGIPNAPFKTTWPALVMKRMIRWAAEHGYEKIAWTTGEQQAERYNLQAATGPITIVRAPEGTVARSEGTYTVVLNSDAAAVLVNNGLGSHRESPGLQGWTRLRMTEPQMKEAFGNDITKRLIEGAEAAQINEDMSVTADDGTRLAEPAGFTLEGEDLRVGGEDLRVGGEGMKQFYDRNLVNITNDLIKKFGARVGAVNIRTKEQERAFTNAQDLLRRTLAGIREDEALAAVDPAAERRLQSEFVSDGGYRARDFIQEELAKHRAGQPQPGFDITPELADAAMGGFPLFQKTGAPRGQIAFAPDITKAPSVITLLRGADLSTFVHELGHFFFEVTNHMANRAGAPAVLVADRDAMLTYLGVSSATEWEQRTPEQRRDGHERLARSFEAYLFEGKAPSLELRSTFSRLRSWMLSVYRTITRLNVELTDEVRGVFDRMLASEEQIAEVQADSELRPLLLEKPEGMSEADWEDYQRLDVEATTEAAKQLESRSLRDMRYAGKAVARELKRLQRQVKDQRDAMREEVVEELAAQPVYRAIRLFRTGKLDGVEVEGMHKLNTELVRQAVGGGPLPGAFNGMTHKEGVHPQAAAELFGFTSADHMLKDILFAPPFREAVEAETDARMRERYGELNSPEEVEEAARAAVHNEIRGRFVATELAALEKSAAGKRVLAAAARRLAQDIIARVRIRDLRPSQYEAAERRAARAAIASGTADLDETIRQKRNQLLQFNLARAAHEARDETKAARDYLTKFANKNTRAAIDQTFLDQIDQIMERYELRAISNVEADRRKSLSEWVEKMRADGFEPAIDADTLAEIGKKPWRELTVEEMRGLLDAIRNIEHLGRMSKKLLTAKDKADLDQAAGEMGQSVRDNATRSVELPPGSRSWWEKVKSGVADYFAMHRKIANMVHVFDGNKYGGVFWERYVRPMNERADWQTERNTQANLRLAALFKPLLTTDTSKREYEPAIGKSISLEDRLMVALNMGNEDNLQRLMGGDAWTPDQIEAIVAPLTGEQWDFVEAVWAELDSYWPEIAAKELRVSGVAPEKVEARPFQLTVDGQLRYFAGGYFPIKYDPDKSSRAEADESAEVLRQMTRGLYTNAQTRRGHTKARVNAVQGRPLRKDFGVIFSHVNQVIHDLAWHEFLIDANRLLRHNAVDSAIREHYGPETLRWMRKALEDIAIGDIPAQNAFEKSIKYLRTGVSISAMGWSLWTSLLQPTGLTQSMARIGVGHVMKGIGGMFASPKKMNEKLEWIYSVSPFMKNRANTMQREINEIRNHIGAKSPVRKQFDKLVPPAVSGVVADSYFYMIGKAQLIADIPTWLGQYEKSLAAGEQQDRAVAIADQAVIDSQGSGLAKDLAGVQRGSQLQQLFTNFYSYFSATMNLMADRTTELRRVGVRDVPYFVVDMSLLSFVPATIASLLYQLLKGDGDDDWEDWIKQLAQDNMVYLLGLMVGVREIGSALAGVGGYQGPAGARFFAETGRFGKQVSQGEVDEPLLRATNSMLGILLHYPSTQLDRTVRGTIEFSEGEAGPQAIAVGPPR